MGLSLRCLTFSGPARAVGRGLLRGRTEPVPARELVEGQRRARAAAVSRRERRAAADGRDSAGDTFGWPSRSAWSWSSAGHDASGAGSPRELRACAAGNGGTTRRTLTRSKTLKSTGTSQREDAGPQRQEGNGPWWQGCGFVSGEALKGEASEGKRTRPVGRRRGAETR